MRMAPGTEPVGMWVVKGHRIRKAVSSCVFQGFGDVLLEDHDFTQKMTKEYRLFCPNRILNIV